MPKDDSSSPQYCALACTVSWFKLNTDGSGIWRGRRASLGIRLGMYTLLISLHWHRDQCASRAHYGACLDLRSCPLSGGGACHDIKVSCFWEVVQHLIMRIVRLQQYVQHVFREANGAVDHL
ncbi:UNVERIFIED_CONTAM: hypothetical protein Sradi_7070500 [Sesamum radiatum]|uniref:Uncharacterized protein n=1 Tax=Sesamum radiatum TaxID=300843 RepID=A0AAW2J566_SESRA